MDGLPVLSQVKSLVQYLTGNSKGARETQNNFLDLCPGFSQAKSLVQIAQGNSEEALKTQKKFIRGLSGTVDAMPGIGHAKGVIHYALGDRAAGDSAMKASSHSLGVTLGGVGGFLVAGPAGAAVGGALGGAYTDAVITVSDMLVHPDRNEGYGIIGTVAQIVEDPTDAGNYVDAVGSVIFDGVAGFAAGQTLGKKIQYKLEERAIQKVVGPEATQHVIDTGEQVHQTRSKNKLGNKKPHVHTRAKDLKTGRVYDGNNKQIRNKIKRNDYMTNQNTELQNRVPNAKPKLKRNPATCAEQQAYNELYKNRPSAHPQDIQSVTARYCQKSGRPVTTKACENCASFREAMGNVVTENLPEGTPIPRSVTKSGIVAGGLRACVSCACTVQNTLFTDSSDSDTSDTTS